MRNIEEKFMREALVLAAKGIGLVEPNPLVGAVIVKNNKIIGKGAHKRFGGPHAEINAFTNCRNERNDPAGATMYVNLEPCCHQGKTGPCTEAIIAAGITKVVFATTDPMPHCSGKGAERLRQAGIEVRRGVMAQEAMALNAPFFKMAQKGKPWVILKWAQSIDGKLAWSNPDSEHRWITNEESRKNAHMLRRRAQAVMVGINTVIADNPMLTPQPGNDKKPLRVVLDSRLSIPLECLLVQTAAKCPVLIYMNRNYLQENELKISMLDALGVKVVGVAPAQDKCDLDAVITDLAERGVGQVLVEGGPCVLAAFLAKNLGDEFRIYISPKILGSDGSADITNAFANIKAMRLMDVRIREFDGDVRIHAVL